MDKTNVLEISDLSIRYEVDKTVYKAVNHIDLSIGKGEILGLVGETGAGKSTTALSVMGLLPRYVARIPSGEIRFNGENLLKKSEEEMQKIRGKHISMIFQDPMTSLNPVFRIGSQIADVIRWHNPQMSREEVDRQVDAMLEKVGIPPSRKNDYPNQFSGGMRQRVMIAIAIACNPELLIADEPTTALDVTIQAQVMRMMRTLQKELQTSILLITHDLGLVASFCDRVAIMYAGEIVECGTLEDIYTPELPHHPYTKGLFGSLPDISSKASRLSPIRGLMPSPAELPDGCRFHPRCGECMDICRRESPVAITDGTHVYACHRLEAREK